MHDSEVVASITGDRSARLIEAYDRYADSLYRYCLASLGEQAEAASAVRDTFAIAAARLPGLREPDLLRAWLYAVARRECRHVRRPGRPAFAPTGVTAGRPGEDATRAWLRGLLEVAVTGLGPGEREVIELELRHGLAVAEIAGVVGLSRAQASALASRARQRLEAGLVAVVVGRAGRRECDWLRMTLADWDGWLTIPLRKQLQQHIGRCAACSTRRDLELHPARLLGHSPGEALADAAGFLVAPGPPDGLRAHTLALAFSEDPDAIAHRAAVLGRAGAFDPVASPSRRPGTGTARPAAGGGSRSRRAWWPSPSSAWPPSPSWTAPGTGSRPHGSSLARRRRRGRQRRCRPLPCRGPRRRARRRRPPRP
jgi:RNA polymerase sigma factor (sigma-70 family)